LVDLLSEFLTKLLWWTKTTTV